MPQRLNAGRFRPLAQLRSNPHLQDIEKTAKSDRFLALAGERRAVFVVTLMPASHLYREDGANANK